MTERGQTIKELRKISKILLLAHGEQLEVELGKIASTDDRKRIWVLIDGKHSPEDISEQTSLNVGSVRNFLTIIEKAELIENPYGKPPIKLLDYVPPKWIELMKLEEVKKEISSEQLKINGKWTNKNKAAR